MKQDGHTQVLRGILRRPSGGVSYYKANTFIKAEIYAEPGESDDRNTSTDDRPSNVDYGTLVFGRLGVLQVGLLTLRVAAQKKSMGL